MRSELRDEQGKDQGPGIGKDEGYLDRYMTKHVGEAGRMKATLGRKRQRSKEEVLNVPSEDQ